MELTGQNIEYIGIGYWAILTTSIFWGLLRNNKSIIVHFVLSSIAFYFALKFYPLELKSTGNKNPAGFLYSPIILIFLYALLRQFYKKVYNMEPDMEAYSGFSSRDKRGLNFLDYVTAIIPIGTSVFIGLYLANK